MNYLIDTNICIYLINRRPSNLIQKFMGFEVGELAVSAVTVAELQYGVAKNQHWRRNQQRLDAFLRPLAVLPYDEAAGRVYGTIRAELERLGQPIGSLDTLIAAQALAHDLILVTNNEREFRRVAGLQVENWVMQ